MQKPSRMTSSQRRIHAGDRVILQVLPEWVSKLPRRSQRVFKFCVGKRYRVSAIEANGCLALDVSQDVDRRFGGFMNELYVEPRYVRRVGQRSERGADGPA